MLLKDYAAPEAEGDNREPSRLLVEVAVRPASLAAAPPGHEAAEVQRAIRDGFRDVLAQLEIERLRAGTRRRSPVWRWFGRVAAFVICSSIGSVATLLLAASHVQRPEVVGSASAEAAAPSTEAASPYSQSTGAPAPSRAAPAAPSVGPATFGLHEQ
jgi:hypothetical protein